MVYTYMCDTHTTCWQVHHQYAVKPNMASQLLPIMCKSVHQYLSSTLYTRIRKDPHRKDLALQPCNKQLGQLK